MKIVIAVVLFFAVLLGVAFYFFAPRFLNRNSQSNQPVTINMWALWEDEALIKPVIDKYQKDHPNVTIKYNFQHSTNYRTRVQTQITQGEGERPDIFMMHISWLPMFLKDGSAAAMPPAVMSLAEYQKTFYPVVSEGFTKDGKVYGFSRGVDGLVMFYNEEILQAAGITTIPQTWPEFVNAAVKTTVLDSTGKIQSAGASLGTTGNVDHWPDIITLLFYQQFGADLTKPNTSGGAEVLKFYTKFITDPRQKTWDVTMAPSTQVFAENKLAFYFAPSWRAQDLKTLNPNLKFKTAPVPQLPGKTVGVASFWGYGVSSKSPNQEAAWEFLKYLTSQESERALYQQATAARPLGVPYSRVDLGPSLAGDPLAGAVIAQAPYFKYWYLSSQTFDNPAGLNDSIIKYYEDAINATLGGTDPLGALGTTASGVQQVLTQYGIVASPPPVTAQ